MPATFIADGYTREAFVTAKNGRSIAVVYRPLPAAERRRLALQTVRLGGCGASGSEAAAQLVAAAIAARLVAWDLFDDAGRPVEITPAAVAALDPAVFERIHEVVARFDDEQESAKN